MLLRLYRPLIPRDVAVHADGFGAAICCAAVSLTEARTDASLTNGNLMLPYLAQPKTAVECAVQRSLQRRDCELHGGLTLFLGLQDANGDVWSGHRDGYVRVWSELSCRPVCQAKRVFHSDIRRALPPP